MSANKVVEIKYGRSLELKEGQPLTPADRQRICQEHWLTNADIDAAHIVRVDDQTGRENTGWAKRNCAGIYIPYPTLDGSSSYYFRIRRDVPDMTIQLDGSTKISRKYAAPYGSRNHIYFPRGVTLEHLQNQEIPIIITEGEYKALSLWRLSLHQSESPRFIPIGLGGVDAWQGRDGKTPLPDGSTTESFGIIPDMRRIEWKDRHVIIAYDSDWRKNPHVRASRRRLSDELKIGGAKVATLNWEERDGKGVDDWLSQAGPDPVLKAIESINWDVTTGWLAMLAVDQKGTPVKNILNAVTALNLAPEWEGVITYNDFTSAIQTTTPPPFGDKHRSRSVLSPTRKDWTDADDIHTTLWLQSKGLNIAKATAADAVQAVADLNRYHAVRDYLNSLQWDGDRRLDTWLSEYLGADPSNYVSQAGKMWMISGVARIMRPGCQVDHMLVFKGKQGRGKSSVLSTLCGDEWFSDNLPNKLHDKDTAQHLSGKWIIELPELSQFKSNEVEDIKSFASRRIDKYRPSYGRRDVAFPRQCIFAASTNSDEFLRDDTGNRRFWTVPINFTNIKQISIDRDQLWAEALHLFRSGEKWWSTDSKFATEQDAFASRYLVLDPWHEQIRSFLGSRSRTTATEVLTFVVPQSASWTKDHRNRVCSTMKKLNWARKRVRSDSQLLWVFEPSDKSDREDGLSFD